MVNSFAKVLLRKKQVRHTVTECLCCLINIEKFINFKINNSIIAVIPISTLLTDLLNANVNHVSGALCFESMLSVNSLGKGHSSFFTACGANFV